MTFLFNKTECSGLTSNGSNVITLTQNLEIWQTYILFLGVGILSIILAKLFNFIRSKIYKEAVCMMNILCHIILYSILKIVNILCRFYLISFCEVFTRFKIFPPHFKFYSKFGGKTTFGTPQGFFFSFGIKVIKDYEMKHNL